MLCDLVCFITVSSIVFVLHAYHQTAFWTLPYNRQATTMDKQNLRWMLHVKVLLKCSDT